MPDSSGGHVEAFPSGDPGPQSQLCVVGVGKEILIKPSNLVEHRAPVHSRASIRPENFFDSVELTGVQFATAPPAILAIRIDQMADFIDAARILVNEDFRSCHPYLGTAFESPTQRGKPIGFRLGVIIQQRDELGVGRRKALVISGTEATVNLITNQLQPEGGIPGELLKRHFRRTIIRSIVYHNHFKRLL
jgi:hypothetical protein